MIPVPGTVLVYTFTWYIPPSTDPSPLYLVGTRIQWWREKRRSLADKVKCIKHELGLGPELSIAQTVGAACTELKEQEPMGRVAQ